MAGGIGLVTVNDAMIKWVVTDYPLGEAVFVRGVFALLPTLFLVSRHGGLASLRVRDWRGQLICAALLAVPIFLFVYSLRHLELGVAVILIYSGPLLATALGSWLLRERVDVWRWSAVGAGFAGVALVVQPTGQTFTPILLLPLLVALLVAARDIVVRRLVVGESTIAIHFYSSVAVLMVALFTVHEWVYLPLAVWLSLALAGLGFGFGIYLVTDALRYADVSLVSPFKYTSVVWALLLGYLLWGEVPTVLVIIGALVIVATGVFLIRQASSSGEVKND